MGEYGDMRYGIVRFNDVINGPGIRVSIYVTGCTHACPGCFNEVLQNKNVGKLWTESETATILKQLKPDYIEGLSLLGGEPMQNAAGLIKLLTKVRENFGNTKNIWCWSGYTWDQIQHRRLMSQLAELCDVIVDGKYIRDLMTDDLVWRGSLNQNIIDVKATLADKPGLLHTISEPVRV